jgi:ABC-type multidrug transport system fused ATPase/permease subunit
LALSFFRFVEATAGRILIDGLDISKMGLTDLRRNLTIIPRMWHAYHDTSKQRLNYFSEDPTILSGTLRSTLDVFNEYQDADIVSVSRCCPRLRKFTFRCQYEALRRVQLIPSEDQETPEDAINVNVFRDLESPVSEGGENFSTG